MLGEPPPPVIRPPNAAADHQFLVAQLYYMARTETAFTERRYETAVYGPGFTETVTETDTDERKLKAGNHE